MNMPEMNFVRRSLLLLPLLIASSMALADDASEQLRERLRQHMNPSAVITSIQRGPAGLWEVVVSGDIFYTDEEGTLLISNAHIIDLKNRRDLTQERLAEIQRIDFDSLPLDLAIKQVKGDGSRRIAVFADPQCTYCKQLEATMAKVSNVTVYLFLLPILSPASEDLSRKVWCATDPNAAWTDLLVRGITPAKQSLKCAALPTEKIKQFSQSVGISATPTLIMADGARQAGALPLDSLEAFIELHSAAVKPGTGVPSATGAENAQKQGSTH
jgi:thiol:disulfide interchange protein DsbC